jgi:hypothetical protein
VAKAMESMFLGRRFFAWRIVLAILAVAGLFTCAQAPADVAGDDDDDDDDATGDDAVSDDAADDADGDIMEQCVAFYAECYGVTADEVESYCSMIDEYHGMGECYDAAIEDYFLCVFENFDCDTFDPYSIMDCADDFTQALTDCESSDDDSDDFCEAGIEFLYDCGYVLYDEYLNEMYLSEAIEWCLFEDPFAYCVATCANESTDCDDMVSCINDQCY